MSASRMDPLNRRTLSTKKGTRRLSNAKTRTRPFRSLRRRRCSCRCRSRRTGRSTGQKRLSENWDVVVVGAGFAGMCAALEAAERGAKRSFWKDESSRRRHRLFIGLDCCRWEPLSENHPEDSPKAFFEDMMRLSHQRSDPELIKVYAEESGAGIDWLADHGTPFYLWEGLPAPELSRCLISPGEGITGGSKLIRC